MGGISWPFQMKEIKGIRLLTYVTGLVNQELLLQNEYLAAENRVLRTHLPRLSLSDPERSSLAEICKRLGRKALAESRAWLNRPPFWPGIGGSSLRSSTAPNTAVTPAGPGSQLEALIVKMAKENSGWGYDRIVDTLA